MEPGQLRVFKRMLLFPLILFAVALFASVHRVVLFAGYDVFVLAVFDYFFSSLYGFMNALVCLCSIQAYGFNPTIRDYMDKLICRKCFKRRTER